LATESRIPLPEQSVSTRSYQYYDLILGAYVCVLLCANLIGPAKVATVQVPVIGAVTFVAGVLFFPISYIFGDILTEVYGYARDRRCVWSGFAALIFAAVMATVIVHLPPAQFWKVDSQTGLDRQATLEEIFGSTPRIVFASIIAFWCGSFVNSYVLAKMKLWSNGRWLWTRIIGSTLCGELVDSGLFYTIAFYGLWPTSNLLEVTATQYVLKSGWEIVMTPVTYRIVGFLKRAEQEDYFDRTTDFTPFSLKA
jgi:queuosine precursor transporter